MLARVCTWLLFNFQPSRVVGLQRTTPEKTSRLHLGCHETKGCSARVRNVMFIVLGVAWVCALGPGLVKSLSQRGLSFGSNGRSHGPGRSRGDHSRSGFVGAAVGVLGALGNFRRARHARNARRRPGVIAAPRLRLSPAARRTRKRRRELLAGFSGVAFGSLLLGMVPGLRMLLVLSAVSTGLLTVYVLALLRLKTPQAVPVAASARRQAYEYAYTRASGE